jgi:hypothetical protein
LTSRGAQWTNKDVVIVPLNSGRSNVLVKFILCNESTNATAELVQVESSFARLHPSPLISPSPSVPNWSRMLTATDEPLQLGVKLGAVLAGNGEALPPLLFETPQPPNGPWPGGLWADVQLRVQARGVPLQVWNFSICFPVMLEHWESEARVVPWEEFPNVQKSNLAAHVMAILKRHEETSAVGVSNSSTRAH